MPTRKLVLLLVALLIAGGTFALSRGMMKNTPQTAVATAAKAPPTHEVLVAAKDLPTGTILKADDMKWQIWPDQQGATGFTVKGQTEITSLVGAVVRESLRSGEPVLNNRIVHRQDQGFMAAVLSPGMRAVSVALTPVGGVAGFVFPGDHVDVIVTHELGRKGESDKGARRVSETILTNVRVLALDQKTNDQVTEPKIAQTATLEVNPKQAETVALVADMGTLSLALRSLASPEEQQAASPASVSDASAKDASALLPPGLQLQDADLLTWDSDVSHVLPPPANRTNSVQRVQIIRGKEASEAIFDLPKP